MSAYDIGVIIGALFIGAVTGAVPLVLGLKRKKKGLAIGGFCTCLAGGFLGGIIPAAVVCIIFVVLILTLGKKKEPANTAVGIVNSAAAHPYANSPAPSNQYSNPASAASLNTAATRTQYTQPAQSGAVPQYAQQPAQQAGATQYAQPVQQGRATLYAQPAQRTAATQYAQPAQQTTATQYAQPAQRTAAAQYAQPAPSNPATSFRQPAQQTETTQYAQPAQQAQATQYSQPAASNQAASFRQAAPANRPVSNSRRIKPYGGDGSYIFFSYSHMNTKEVLEVIERLQADGYNVWFDEGITPGSEWDENIAHHIDKCSYFIGYITNNYINSQNCRDELNYARDLNKERLLIYGEEVELPKGMQMRMNRLQAIYRDKYPDPEDFFEKLMNANGIEKCK